MSCVSRLTVLSSQDEPAEEFIERRLRCVGHPAVNGRDLNGSAAWGYQPMETLLMGEPGNGAGSRIAGANLRECIEMLSNQFQIPVRPKRQKPAFVNVHNALQEGPFS